MANWYQWQENNLFLHVQLQPRASRDEIVGPHGEYLKIRITTPPLEGRANKHLIKFLANSFGVSQQQVSIEKGEQSRIKLIKIIAPKNLECIQL
ncbi:MAG: DUF167 family protein [Gammaproteobacteria bacterium]